MGRGAKISRQQDYESFGSLMPGRNYSSDAYRFGFQGQIKDPEIYGEANSYAFDFRMDDPRVGDSGAWIRSQPSILTGHHTHSAATG
jgi:hypothetical protein